MPMPGASTPASPLHDHRDVGRSVPAPDEAVVERRCEVLVIGGGAAGLFCAAIAAARGRRVLVLDHATRIGRKILISGGGRCNFTNRHATPANYVSRNPDFCRSALARYRPEDFIALVERHRIPYHEKKLGQLFCDGPASAIVALLLAECASAGAEVLTGIEVQQVERTSTPPAGDGFRVRTQAGSFVSDRLVIATGGLSVPSIGATDFGYRLARQFGLQVVETLPALVPVTLPPESGVGTLSGVSVPAVVAAGAARFADDLLFTHRGLSGPAVLQASTYWQPGTALRIDLAPEADLAARLTTARAAGEPLSIAGVLAEHLPKRLVAEFLAGSGEAQLPVRQASVRQLGAIAARFHAWSVVPSGTEGYRKAEVTRGGVDTRGLSSQTMEARSVPGLFFIGEVVDVTGWLGGYNFQWAWASAHACGTAV